LKKHMWKLSVTGLLFFLYTPLFAKNYYFSSTAGNDSYTTTQAQNPSTPWRSITKLNTVFSILVGGDSILFKRGEIFYGTIAVTSSGLINKNIIISAYGAGALPVISGLSTVSNWSADAITGIYKAVATGVPIVSGRGTALNIVTINNQVQQLGRYPNANAANGGYLKYESFSDTLGITSITDTQLTGTINWTGAEVVIRKKLWVLDRCDITAHNGNTIYYTNPNGSSYSCTNNFGYFIQDDIRTLDQFGEWYFDGINRELKVYFGTASPASYNVKAATIDALLTINAKRYITISNLSFEGANLYGVYTSGCDYINVKNCTFNNIGNTAVYMESGSDLLVDNTNTNNILNNAIQFVCPVDSNITIRNCVINKTGTIRGMGASNGGSYKGIAVDLAKNLVIENNRVDTTGYIAIEFDGSNVLVKNNVVNYFCFNKDDAGGIYSWVPQVGNIDVNYTNRIIKGNIVMNGIGAPDGRSSSNLFVSGIYLDGTIMNVDVLDNTVFNMGKNGIHCNNPDHITISGNTSFNNLNAVSFMRWPWATISDLKIEKNIFYPKTSTQRNLYYTNAALNEPDSTSLQTVLHSLGNIDRNIYSTSNPTGFSYEVYSYENGPLIPFAPQSIEGWQSYSGKDSHSTKPFREAPSYYLRSTIGSNSITNGSFNQGISGITVVGSGVSSVWDNNGIVAGGALKVVMNNPIANRYALIYSPAGSVTASKKYVLRFKTAGTTTFGFLKAYLRKTASPYTALASPQVKVFDLSVKKHEFLFAAPTTEANASFIIEIEQSSGTVYIDDIEFYEADADVYNVNDYLRFEYNATNAPVTVNLGANYTGVDTAYYAGSITLQPFTSKILVKDTSVLRQSLAMQVNAPNIPCYGSSTNITVAATGGIPPYRGTGTFSVTAGTYTFSVSDIRGVSVTRTVTVTQPSAPLRLTAATGTITINGGTTWVNLSVTGGTAPYNGTLNFLNVPAGTHVYYIKDGKSCSDSITVTINQPEPLRAFATAISVKCYGGTGVVTITATGGIPPYAGTGVFSIAAGTYRYKVRDAAGAVAYAPVVIAQPALLVASVTAGTITTFGGRTSVNVTATGGTAPYTGTGIINNVPAGTYSYSVTDANGCIDTTAVTILQPPSLLTATASSANIGCFDGSTSINVTASGGLAPYTGIGTYAVSAGKGALKVSFPAVVSDIYTLLYYTIGSISPSKNYVLRFSTVGSAANGVLRAAIRQTYSPWAAIVPRQIASFGMARADHEFIFTAPPSETAASFLIEVNQSSGTTYIDNIAFFEADANNKPVGNNLYTFGDFENNINNIFSYSSNDNHLLQWDTTRKISRTYYFTVSDATGASVNAVAKTTQPAAALVANVTASASTVTVTAAGGTAPYTGTGIFTNVAAGSRTYTVTDANGCSSSGTVTITSARSIVINDHKQLLKAIVYPNPSSSSFDLWLQKPDGIHTTVMVTTAEGKLVYKKEGRKQHFVFGENFHPGLYIVIVQYGTESETIKLIKAK
jgi:hypothetical protein